MKTFQEWLEIREGSQGLRARERRAVGLAKRAERLKNFRGRHSQAEEDLGQDVGRALVAGVQADRNMRRRERQRRAEIMSASKEGRKMANLTTSAKLSDNRLRSRDANAGIAMSYWKNDDGTIGGIGHEEIKAQLPSLRKYVPTHEIGKPAPFGVTRRPI